MHEAVNHHRLRTLAAIRSKAVAYQNKKQHPTFWFAFVLVVALLLLRLTFLDGDHQRPVQDAINWLGVSAAVLAMLVWQIRGSQPVWQMLILRALHKYKREQGVLTQSADLDAAMGTVILGGVLQIEPLLRWLDDEERICRGQ